MDRQEPRMVQLLPGLAAGEAELVVQVADTCLKAPTDFPAAGTAYSAWTLSTRERAMEAWANYVFVQLVDAAPGYMAFSFRPSLPTTAVVTEKIDDIWGVVKEHSYIALASDDVPDRADTYAGENVLDVQETPLRGGAVQVKVITTPLTQVTLEEERYDSETGLVVDEPKTYYLTDTKPDGASVDSSGAYRVVEPRKHNLYVMTSRKAVTLPVGYNSARTWLTQERGVFWPPVLTYLNYTPVYDSGGTFVVKMLLTLGIRESYQGHCRVTNKEWWQKLAPGLGGTIFTPTEMNTAPMYYKGVYLDLDIPETLHAQHVFTESNLTGDDDTYERFFNRIVFPATNVVDWPGSVIGSFESQPRDGGYHCRLKTHARPFAAYQADAVRFT